MKYARSLEIIGTTFCYKSGQFHRQQSSIPGSALQSRLEIHLQEKKTQISQLILHPRFRIIHFKKLCLFYSAEKPGREQARAVREGPDRARQAHHEAVLPAAAQVRGVGQPPQEDGRDRQDRHDGAAAGDLLQARLRIQGAGEEGKTF